MSKKTKKNLRVKSMLGLTTFVIGAGIIYLSASSSLSASADSGAVAIPANLIAISIGAFLIVIGAMVLLFVFASK